MTAFSPKNYQSQVLESIETYLQACHEFETASIAFNAVTERLWGQGISYSALSGFPTDMPFFCLRVPTGGGKTWLAAKSVALVNSQLLRTDHSVILWLVPSNPIREQTLTALKDHGHPYHAALKEAGEIRVLDLEEAKNVTRATLDMATTIIVATRQAFQVEDDEIRKVYQSSGSLMHHFENLEEVQRAGLLWDGEGPEATIPYSLANVLRLRRPFVIVDEAHNSRTELAFDTLARFNPSGILELTATPDTERTPSNVLHSVSAAELKAEEMIKLPVVLQTEPDWQQCLADAIARRGALQKLADDARRSGADYLRPIVLIQAAPRRQNIDTLHVDRVREELVSNHRIPTDEIVVATGEEKGLEKIEAEYKLGISNPDCSVKYVITQRALAEGWDCPFAYVLVSMAELQSATAVEQLLGRILRQPGARRTKSEMLNQSYAIVVSKSFADTASALRDRLVTGAGFERREVTDFVKAANPDQGRIDLEAFGNRVSVRPVVINLPEKPTLKSVPQSLKEKVQWDDSEHTLTVKAPLTEDETESLKSTVKSDDAKSAIEQGGEASRTTALDHLQTPSEKGDLFHVPQLSLYVQDELLPFDDLELLDYEWDLSNCEYVPTEDQIGQLTAGFKSTESGLIDVDEESGRVVSKFLSDLQRDLGLAYKPEEWDEVHLAAWLCRNLPEPTVTHDSKQAYVLGWLRELLQIDGFSMSRVNQQKFLIRNLIESQIRLLRRESIGTAFQDTLFGSEKGKKVAVTGEVVFTYHPQAYAPPNDYDNRFGSFDFKRHYYPRVGDFDTKEEFQCACWLDTEAQKGRISYWVRNLVRREACSFFLQKADGRFYPDFLARLPSNVILAVEYKGSDRWADAKDDRLIGALWAELSDGDCRFVMVKDKEWHQIDAMLD